jgi:hypothetical protein
MVAITAVVQNVTPPRVLVSVTGLTIADSVAVYRVVAGERTLIRGGYNESVTDASYVRVDAEIPFGVPVSYAAVVNDASEFTTSPVTYNIDMPIVSDAITGLSAEVMIYEWPSLAAQRQATVLDVNGRNVAVLGPVPQPRSVVTFRTPDAASKAALLDVLTNATNGIVQIRQPGNVSDVDSYQSVIGLVRERATRRGHNEARYWPIDVVETDPWAAELEAQGFTLQDIADAYTASGVPINSNPYFETNASGWTTAAGPSFVRSTAQFHEGVASGLMTPNGVTSTAEVFTDLYPAPAGDTFRFESWVRCAASRNVVIALYWYTSGAGFISSTTVTVAVTANTWTQIAVQAEAPSTTAQARGRFILQSTPPAGHLLYVDESELTQVLTLKDLADDYATLLAIAQEDWS